jgi:hypothetical protein
MPSQAIQCPLLLRRKRERERERERGGGGPTSLHPEGVFKCFKTEGQEFFSVEELILNFSWGPAGAVQDQTSVVHFQRLSSPQYLACHRLTHVLASLGPATWQDQAVILSPRAAIIIGSCQVLEHLLVALAGTSPWHCALLLVMQLRKDTLVLNFLAREKRYSCPVVPNFPPRR